MDNANDLIAMIQAKPELAHKALAKLKRIRRRDQKKTGYVESHIHVTPDLVGKDVTLTEDELLEQRAEDYGELLKTNPSLEAKALIKFEAQRAYNIEKINKRAVVTQRYYNQKEALRKIAVETIQALVEGGNKLTRFQKEVRKELRLAEQMGITIPFLFKGSKATLKGTIKAEYKAITSYLNHEDDLEQISNAIAEMSIDERLQYEKIARKFVSKLIMEDNNNERTQTPSIAG